MFSKIHFNSQNQPGGAAAGQAPPPPPPGSYNTNPTPGPFINPPTSDLDRRRANFRSRTDENDAQKAGPKNRYGIENIAI